MDKFVKTRIASILGILVNLFLFILKIALGIASHSQAMIADAMNSLGDILSSFMTFIGNKIASKPSDEDHHLGHGKAEYIFSLLISILMFYLSISLLVSSIQAIINPREYIFSYFLIIGCLITIFMKLGMWIYTRKIAIKYNSLLMEANAKDHRNDSVITTFNLISVILGYFHIFIFDSIVGVGIAIWIMISAFGIFKKSYDVLMDKAIDEETKNKVMRIISKHPEIKNINHFNTTPVGYRYQISFTIFVDGNLSTFESHKIADDLEKEITSSIWEIYLTVIHVNPIDE